MVTKSLLRNNVQIVVGSPITEITPSSVILQSGKQIESDLTIWAAGIKGLDVKTTPQIERSTSGRIFVDNYSRIKGFENIFAIGDISAFTLSDGQIAPQLAQFAVRQARSVAKNIIRKSNKTLWIWDIEQYKQVYIQSNRVSRGTDQTRDFDIILIRYQHVLFTCRFIGKNILIVIGGILRG